MSITEHLDRLPREVVKSFSLEMFKTSLDMILCNLLYMNLLRRGIALHDLQGSLPTPTIL